MLFKTKILKFTEEFPPKIPYILKGLPSNIVNLIHKEFTVFLQELAIETDFLETLASIIKPLSTITEHMVNHIRLRSLTDDKKSLQDILENGFDWDKVAMYVHGKNIHTVLVDANSNLYNEFKLSLLINFHGNIISTSDYLRFSMKINDFARNHFSEIYQQLPGKINDQLDSYVQQYPTWYVIGYFKDLLYLTLGIDAVLDANILLIKNLDSIESMTAHPDNKLNP